MPSSFDLEDGAGPLSQRRLVICACLDLEGTRWGVPEAVRRASAAGLTVLVYVHMPRSRSWQNAETISALAGLPPLDPYLAAVDEVKALAGEWAGKVQCVPVPELSRIAELVEAVLAEGGCEAVFVGFGSDRALPVGCRLCAEAEAECEAIPMPAHPH